MARSEGGRPDCRSRRSQELVCSGINPAAVVLNAFVPVDILRGQDEMLREIFRGADEIARVFDIHCYRTQKLPLLTRFLLSQ